MSASVHCSRTRQPHGAPRRAQDDDRMLAYAARRLAAVLPTLLIIIPVAFVVIRMAPGGPFDAEQSLPPEVKANLERAYGLDQPLIRQYWRYLAGVAHGDFGPSMKYRDLPVSTLIAQGLPVSLT